MKPPCETISKPLTLPGGLQEPKLSPGTVLPNANALAPLIGRQSYGGRELLGSISRRRDCRLLRSRIRVSKNRFRSPPDRTPKIRRRRAQRRSLALYKAFPRALPPPEGFGGVSIPRLIYVD